MKTNRNPIIKAILFDAEGVVVDTEPLWDKSQRVLLANYGVQYDREKLKPRMAGRNLVEGAAIMIDYYNLKSNPELLAKERFGIISKLFRNEINFIEGFSQFMNCVKSSQYQTAIATAMSRSLMDLVDSRLKLREIFNQHVYHVEDVGNRSKPDPALFLFAAECLHVEPNECMVIEDAPNGIEAANAAGMLSVGITTTFNRSVLHQAAIIIDNFKELIPTLRLPA